MRSSLISPFVIWCSFLFLLLSCKESKVVERYENGNIKAEAEFRNDMKNGVLKKYYKSGKLKGTIEYLNDTIDGLVFSYFENGEIEFKGLYENGAIVEFEKYDSLGSLTDWKMDLTISHEFSNDSTLDLRFELKNKKFDVMRVTANVFRNDYSMGSIEKNTKGSIIQSISVLSDRDSGYVFLGRVYDIQLLGDSTNAIVRNASNFHYVIK